MDEKKLAQLLKQAENNEANNQLDQAAVLYEKIIANSNPNSSNKKIEQMRLTAFNRITDLYTYHVSENYDVGLALAEQYQAEATSYFHQRSALSRIGGYAYHYGDNKRALTVYRAALELVEQEADEEGLPSAYSDLASAYISVGRLEDAATYFKKAIEQHKYLGRENTEGVANVRNRLGLVYHQQGEISKAIDAHERYLKFYQEFRSEDVQSNMTAFNNLGEGYLMAYDHQTAHHFFTRGLALAKDGFYLAITADLYRNQGVAFGYQGQFEAALEKLNHALKMCQESKNASIIAQTLYSLSLTEFELGHNEKAFAHAQELLRMAGTSSASTHYANAIHLIGIYYQHKGELQTSEKYWQEAVYMAHEAKQRYLLWQLHAKMAEIASTPDLAQVHYKIAADILARIIMEGITDPILQNTFRRAKSVTAVFNHLKTD